MIQKLDDNIEQKKAVSSNSSKEAFFLREGVKNGKESLSPLGVVKVLLRERAMKQVDLADKIRLSRQALNNYLRGEWSTPTQIKIKISQVLGVDSSVIWDLAAAK